MKHFPLETLIKSLGTLNPTVVTKTVAEHGQQAAYLLQLMIDQPLGVQERFNRVLLELLLESGWVPSQTVYWELPIMAKGQPFTLTITMGGEGHGNSSVKDVGCCNQS